MQRLRHTFRPSKFFGIPVLLLLAALLGGCGSGNDLSFPTEYQAVFLDNGQVFFGKLADAGSPFLTLREVYYVQTMVEKDQKKANILIKRGSEWHGPDFMRINSRHVVVIEPVGPDSRVAKLIHAAKAAPSPRVDIPPQSPAPKVEQSAPVPPVGSAPSAPAPAAPASKPHRH